MQQFFIITTSKKEIKDVTPLFSKYNVKTFADLAEVYKDYPKLAHLPLFFAEEDAKTFLQKILPKKPGRRAGSKLSAEHKLRISEAMKRKHAEG